MNDYTLTMIIDHLTDEECKALVDAIHKILKENNIPTENVSIQIW